MRQAVSTVYEGLLEEMVNERELDLADEDDMPATGKKALTSKEQLELKSLAELLVQHGRALDGIDVNEPTSSASGVDGEEDTIEGGHPVEEVNWRRGRVALAVEALWDQVPIIRDWEATLEFLLLDHSSGGSGTPKAKSKSKKAAAPTNRPDPICCLTEEEETLLVEALVASLSKVTSGNASATHRKVSV